MADSPNENYIINYYSVRHPEKYNRKIIRQISPLKKEGQDRVIAAIEKRQEETKRLQQTKPWKGVVTVLEINTRRATYSTTSGRVISRSPKTGRFVRTPRRFKTR